MKVLKNEQSWKVIRSGLFVVKLLGYIYRMDKSSSSDLDASVPREGSAVVDVEEEVIYYDHLYEISHEIVCTLMGKLSHSLARMNAVNPLQSIAPVIFHTFEVFEIVAHVIISKCSFPSQTLKKYTVIVERCFIAVAAAVEACASYLMRSWSDSIIAVSDSNATSDKDSVLVGELVTVLLRGLRACVRFYRFTRDDGLVTTDGTNFMIMVGKATHSIGAISRSIHGDAIQFTAANLLLELQAKLCGSFKLCANLEAASEPLSTRLPPAYQYQWSEQREQFESPLAPLRKNYHNNSYLLFEGEVTKFSAESKTVHDYLPTPSSGLMNDISYMPTPYSQRNYNLQSADKLSAFILCVRPVLVGMISLLSAGESSPEFSTTNNSLQLRLRSVIKLITLLRSISYSFYENQFLMQVSE